MKQDEARHFKVDGLLSLGVHFRVTRMSLFLFSVRHALRSAVRPHKLTHTHGHAHTHSQSQSQSRTTKWWARKGFPLPCGSGIKKDDSRWCRARHRDERQVAVCLQDFFFCSQTIFEGSFLFSLFFSKFLQSYKVSYHNYNHPPLRASRWR